MILIYVMALIMISMGLIGPDNLGPKMAPGWLIVGIILLAICIWRSLSGEKRPDSKVSELVAMIKIVATLDRKLRSTNDPVEIRALQAELDLAEYNLKKFRATHDYDHEGNLVKSNKRLRYRDMKK